LSFLHVRPNIFDADEQLHHAVPLIRGNRPEAAVNPFGARRFDLPIPQGIIRGDFPAEQSGVKRFQFFWLLGQ
jgi:hypothetical protein